MSESRFVTVTGNKPRLRVVALVTTGTAALLGTYYEGVIGFIDAIGGGLSGAVSGFSSWLSGDLIGGLFGVGASVATAAWLSNAAFLRDTFGVLALPAAAVEFAIIFIVLLEYGPTGIRTALGAFR